jgi:hypothetical protein
MVVRGINRVEGTVWGWTESSSGLSDGEIAVESSTVDGIQPKGNGGVKSSTKHGKAENGADHHIGTKGKVDGDTSTIGIGAGSGMMNDGGEVAMIGSIEVRRVTNSTTKLDRFKGVGVIKVNKPSCSVRALGLEPKVKG